MSPTQARRLAAPTHHQSLNPAFENSGAGQVHAQDRHAASVGTSLIRQVPAEGLTLTQVSERGRLRTGLSTSNLNSSILESSQNFVADSALEQVPVTLPTDFPSSEASP